MKHDQLVDLAKGLTKFAQAFGALPKNLLLAALSGQPILTENERISADQARKLIEAFPHLALNTSARQKLWRDVQSDPYTLDFEVLRDAIDSDLRSASRAYRYIVPPMIKAQTKISGFVAMKAGKIEAIIHSFSDDKQQVQEIVKLLEPFFDSR